MHVVAPTCPLWSVARWAARLLAGLAVACGVGAGAFPAAAPHPGVTGLPAAPAASTPAVPSSCPCGTPAVRPDAGVRTGGPAGAGPAVDSRVGVLTAAGPAVDSRVGGLTGAGVGTRAAERDAAGPAPADAPAPAPAAVVAAGPASRG
ncbi:hypothetical protein, partial [Micromonospora sp. CPCC 205561]|uniref:hypothetical protein n=1 Tax=Micromonospora sp. CPCC 205561 TaxID=3122407 RepID=UPI002FF200B0